MKSKLIITVFVFLAISFAINVVQYFRLKNKSVAEKAMIAMEKSDSLADHAASMKNINDDIRNTKYGNNKSAGNYITVRGFKMYYETYGEGSPVLMIHPNSGSIYAFLYQIPYFAAHHKVIIADSRAQGKSTDTSDSLSYEIMADDLNALLDALHLDSVNVIGWSDGGINGLLLAIRHPDKVKKLAITGANLSPDTFALDPYIYYWANSLYDSLKGLKQTPQIKNEIKITDLMVHQPHISAAQLNTIKCPTLVIGGDHDLILPKHTMYIADNIPKSYLWLIPNSGHATPLFKKEQFNKVVNDFFNKPYRKIEKENKFD